MMSLSQHIATLDEGLTRTLRGLLKAGLRTGEAEINTWHPSVSFYDF